MRESTYGRQGGRKCVYTVLGSLGAAAAVCVLAAVVLLATAPAPEIRVIKPPNDNREYELCALCMVSLAPCSHTPPLPRPAPSL